MTDLQTLFQEVNRLSADELQQLYEYIIENRNKFSEAEKAPVKARIPDLHAHLGEFWMSDDFDDELPDDFWGFDNGTAS